MGKLIEEETNKDRKDEMIRETGIKGSSELLKLQTLLFPCDYELSKSQWESIGIQMEKVKKDMPIEIGRPPRDIFKYHNGYKAVEWRNWIILFSLPLLKVYLDKRHLQGWANFVKAIIMKETDSIKYCGPSWTHWQFPMERVCGILQPLIKSKIKPYSNLANMLTLLQQFYMLPFFFYLKSYFQRKPLKQWSKERVFSTEGNINRNDLEMEVNNYGVRYGRLRTSDGQYISSCCIKRNNKIARNNYCAQIRRTIDKLAHRPNAPPQLVIVDIYGIVNYYLVHELNHQVYMLAYVQLTSKIVEDEYGCFAKIDNRYYIIDKENAFDDSNWENIGH
ncbi:hypothetical protein GLOIN_2v1644898 [Rhizophagus irregularis DAOM 181602=DAOM 197198]|nr:hypothetical protein GLOIN_2v1644898 [Rhizophagus irregularis DAOM 181602=DAOM 197198]